MKKFFLLILFCQVTIVAISQNPDSTELLKKIDSLEKRLNESNYTRIPNKDFEKILDDKVNGGINQWLNERKIIVLALVGIISFALGFLLKYYYSENTRNLIEENVKEKNKEINEKINGFIDLQKTNYAELDDRVKQNMEVFKIQLDKNENLLIDVRKEITGKVDAIAGQQREFTNASTLLIEKKFSDTLSFVAYDIADGIIDRAKERNYNGKDLIDSLNKYLESESLNISEDKKILMIDTLMRCYYCTPVDDHYENMVKLLNKYEGAYQGKLLPDTYANAAIALCNNYAYFGMASYRDSCLENCIKAINLSPDYGIAYMLKLEIYMISYIKAFDESEKTEALKKIDDTFKSIDNSLSDVLPVEILGRLYSDKPISYLKEAITTLENKFMKQLNKIRERGIEAFVKNYDKTIASERNKKIMNDTLVYGLGKSPNIDGTWYPEQTIIAGKDVSGSQKNNILLLNGAAYSRAIADYNDVGVAYFIAGETPFELNIYVTDGLNKEKVFKCIYAVKGDSLVVCYGAPDADRPTDFTSTAQNQNTLVGYKKSEATNNNQD